MFYPYVCINKECENYNKEVTITKPMSECNRDEFCECCGGKIVRPISSYHGSYKSTDGFYARSQS